MLELTPGIHGREPPVDGCLGLVSFGFQCGNFTFEDSLIANPTILEGPGRDAVARQRRHELAAMCDVVLSQPAASMDEDGDRVRSASGRKTQVAKLQRVLTVLDARVGRWILEFPQIRHAEKVGPVLGERR